MTKEDRNLLEEHVARWQRVGPLLERQREEDVRGSNTVVDVASFGRLWIEAVRACPPGSTSGLVEQQRLFTKLRRSG